VLANFVEAIAEDRLRAQAAWMRSMHRHGHAKRLLGRDRADYHVVEASALRRGDLVLVEANETIPADGEVIEGAAAVNESAVTGESAPVLRAAGGDSSSVSGGTRVLSDWLLVRVTSREGAGLLDRMLATVQGQRNRTPDEPALSLLLAMLTVVFLLALVDLAPALSLAPSTGESGIPTLSAFVALLACFIPTTIAAVRSAILIAGMDRTSHANVIAISARAVEAGNVNVVVLDKTGTIAIAHTIYRFSAQERMSGVDLEGRKLRKGAPDAVRRFVYAEGGSWPIALSEMIDRVARSGATLPGNRSG
jgi:potassium-transporting ATPase ATP-binding subunit